MTALLLTSGPLPVALLPAPKIVSPALRLVAGAEPPAYAFSLAEWVFAPTLLTFNPTATVKRSEPRQVMTRWREGGHNWYIVRGHPWRFREDELQKHQYVIDIAFRRRVTVAA